MMELDDISGSRYSDGNVPNVNWNDDKFQVNCNNSDNANDNLRARLEVSGRESPISDFLLLSN